MSQPIIDVSDFEAGMNGWEFKFWMPPGRKASMKIIEGEGFRSRHLLQFDADGQDDDGIFFIQKSFASDVEGPWTWAFVSWWLRVEGLTKLNSWPRVVYLGPPKDLAKMETQHSFHWFAGQDGLITCPTCGDWYGHMFKAEFSEGIDTLQVCVGWKINWETRRTLFIDDVLVRAT